MSLPSVWMGIAVVAALAKVTCAILSARWPGGAEAILATGRGRLVYAGGKITPLIAVGAVLTSYKMSDPSIETGWLVLVFAAVLFYDAYVVWLRLTGRWQGADHKCDSGGSRNDG